MRCAALVLALAGCGDNQDPEGARELWGRIHEQDYRKWARAPGYEQRRSSNAPHGDDVDIYVSPEIVEALASGERLERWPEGALIVKDGFDGSDLELVAVMEKRPQGWFFAEYDGSGDADYSGRPEVCVDCHERGDDFVRAFALPDTD